MAERCRALLEALPPPFDSLRLSFGLASGQVVMGMIGSMNRTEIAVIGDIANLASRLQELSKLALTTEAGQDQLGEFKRVMAICSSSLLLTSDLSRRKFSNFSHIDSSLATT
jgi:hypothetical protein